MAEKATGIVVVADAREARSGVIEILKGMSGVAVKVESLSCGDYLVGGGCVVERKRAADFLASLADGRYLRQVRYMAERFQKVVYLVEGDPLADPGGFSPASLSGALAVLCLMPGFSVLHSEGVGESAGLIAALARRCQLEPAAGSSLRGGSPAGNGRTAQLFFIEGLPGVGAKRARQILEHFGTPGRALAASREEWLKVKGLGRETVERILEVLG